MKNRQEQGRQEKKQGRQEQDRQEQELDRREQKQGRQEQDRQEKKQQIDNSWSLTGRSKRRIDRMDNTKDMSKKNNDAEKALLVVSFGTTHWKTCEETIGAIEDHLEKAMPSLKQYRAWTSGMIIRRLKERDGISIDNVEEAMKRMADEGIKDVLIVPTHMIPGAENDKMMDVVRANKSLFDEIRVSSPLLSSRNDIDRLAGVIASELLGSKEDALVLMGHGSAEKEEANKVYTELQEAFRSQGNDNVFVGTVEGTPSLEEVIEKLKSAGECPIRSVMLAPLMIVAGDHAINDMAGDDEDSWLYRIGSEIGHGCLIEPVLRGLGSYAGVREIFLQHAIEAEEIV